MKTRGLWVAVVCCLLALGVSAQAVATDSFAAVQAHLDASVSDGAVAGGAVLVWHKGEVVFSTGFGFADVATQRAFTVDTPVVVASISKPMLGTALFCLADGGKLDVASPVSAYLPAFEDCKLESGEALSRQPTVVELLTHTAGLRGDSSQNGRIWYASWTKNRPLEEVVDRVAREIPFEAQPGKRMRYSGIGTDIAARVGEVVTGLPRNEMLRSVLCEPLGMDSTYYRDKHGIKQIDREMPTQYYIGKETGKLRLSRKRFLPDINRYSSSGGTIISTAPDLLKWLLMIRSGGVHDDAVYLSPTIFNAMMSPQGLGNRAKGGLAILRKNDQGEPVAYGHTGSSGTSIWIDFESDTIGIMLTQTRGKDIVPFRRELEKRIAQAVE